MPGDTEDIIIKKLERIEQRLNKLEASRSPENIIRESKKIELETHHDDEPSIPIGSVISLIIGGLILFNTVPNFLFRNLFNTYQSTYSSGFDFISLVFMALGFFLVFMGARGIMRYRSKRAGGESHKIDLTSQSAKTLEIKNSSDKTQEDIPKTKQKDSIEYQIASHWFSIVGIIAILLGVVFFLKYAFDNHLIGPTGQVSIGIIFGLILLAAGEYFRTKYAKYSEIITGGGLGVLYLSVWAAFGVFHLLDANILLAGMSLVTICAALLAVRYDAIAIAVIAVVGGFATPAVLSRGFDNQFLLLSYVVILNLGVLFVALFKNWRTLNILTFLGTYFVFTIWYGSYYDPTKFLTTLIFLTILFVIFSLVWVVYNLIYEKAVEEQDILLVVLNAVVYFGFSYTILSKNYVDYLGFFAFGLAVYYFVFGFIAYTKFKAESALTLGLLGVSIIFLTVAVPFQVKKNLITLIWIVEAAVILWLGFWLSSYKLRVAALGIYILVVIRLIFFDSIVPLAEFQLLANRRFLTYIAAAISAGIASWFYWKNREKTQADEHIILPALLIGLNVILVVALTLESFSYFDAKISGLNKKLYKSEVPTAVLGTQTITKTIDRPDNDYSVGCGSTMNKDLMLGVDTSCSPPVNVITKLVFTDLPIQPNSTVSAVNILLAPIEDVHYSVKLKITLENTKGGLSTPIEWEIPVNGKGNYVVTTDLSSALQKIISGGYWQLGDSLIVTIEPVKVGQQSLIKIYSYEQNPGLVARLNVSFNSLETVSQQVVPYNQNNSINNYQNNYPTIPTPPSYQNNYNNYQPDPKVQAEIKSLTAERNFSISIIWLLYSLTLLIIGVVTKYKPIRLSALVFFAVTILKVFLVDSSNLAQIYRIVAFIGLGTILLVVAYIYQRYKDKINAFLL